MININDIQSQMAGFGSEHGLGDFKIWDMTCVMPRNSEDKKQNHGKKSLFLDGNAIADFKKHH